MGIFSDIFGSTGDVSSLDRMVGRLSESLDKAIDGIFKILMPTSYANAVSLVEYGFFDSGKSFAPTPFVRRAAAENSEKWNGLISSLCEESLTHARVNIAEQVKAVEDQVRKDIYESAAKHGVPYDIAEVFKMRFKHNDRNVTMCEWVHGDSEDPREYHAKRWNGGNGNNGKPNGLDGYVFALDKPPVIDKKTGQRGYPGDLPNCSCFVVPVIR